MNHNILFWMTASTQCMYEPNVIMYIMENGDEMLKYCIKKGHPSNDIFVLKLKSKNVVFHIDYNYFIVLRLL